jgi:hypothetical protein
LKTLWPWLRSRDSILVHIQVQLESCFLHVLSCLPTEIGCFYSDGH